MVSVIIFSLVGLFIYKTTEKSIDLKSSHTKKYYLDKLLQGNEHFAKSESHHPNEDLKHLEEAAKKQTPFAIVLCCSDSRVSPELIFDQGIGDLFVVRTAGEIIGTLEIGTIEYAVEHLNVNLIIVMGHENCGVVKAFVEGEQADGHIKDIIDSIKHEKEIQFVPLSDTDRLNNCVKANVIHAITKLQTESGIIKDKIKKGALQVFGMRYDLHNLKVSVYN
jgi:carbonic anhydrase